MNGLSQIRQQNHASWGSPISRALVALDFLPVFHNSKDCKRKQSLQDGWKREDCSTPFQAPLWLCPLAWCSSSMTGTWNLKGLMHLLPLSHCKPALLPRDASHITNARLQKPPPSHNCTSYHHLHSLPPFPPLASAPPLLLLLACSLLPTLLLLLSPPLSCFLLIHGHVFVCNGW